MACIKLRGLWQAIPVGTFHVGIPNVAGATKNEEAKINFLVVAASCASRR
jgi:hypothetical protein